MNLLIVDDEYYIVKGMVALINRQALGIAEIFTAYSLEQAQRIIEREKIDLLLTDIEMPQGSGLTLIEWICAENYPIVSLILTGHQRFDYVQKALALHCHGYILKPVDKFTLEAELRKAIVSVRNRVEETPVPSNLDTDNFIKKIRTYIRDNLSSPDLNRSTIAEHMHMNPDYLSSVFHSKFDQTLSSYINLMRIDKAKELLTHTNLSLQEISERSGFSSSSYFHKQFKKTTGMTPQEYRHFL